MTKTNRPVNQHTSRLIFVSTCYRVAGLFPYLEDEDGARVTTAVQGEVGGHWGTGGEEVDAGVQSLATQVLAAQDNIVGQGRHVGATNGGKKAGDDGVCRWVICG